MTSFLIRFYSSFKFRDDDFVVLDKTSQQFLIQCNGLLRWFLQSLFVRVLDGHFSDFISSWALDGYTLNSGFISSYALDGCTFASFLTQVSSRLKFWTDVPCFIFNLGFISSLSFGRMYLVPFFLLRKAYGRYILASKDFIHPFLFFFFVDQSEWLYKDKGFQ